MGTFILYADASPISLDGWVDDQDAGIIWTLRSESLGYPWAAREGTIRFQITGLCCELNSDGTPRDPATVTGITLLTAGVYFDGAGVQAGCQAARQFDGPTEEPLMDGPVTVPFSVPDFAYPGTLTTLAALAAGGIGWHAIASIDEQGGEVFVYPAGFGGKQQIRGTYEEVSTQTTTPIVDAGPMQAALGPAPSVVTTVATITPGTNNGTLTYAWTYESGPAGAPTPTIAAPTALNTTITFDAFAAGSYVFKLTVTTEDGSFTPTDTFTVTMTTTPPRVSSGSTSVVWG